jgi:ADP-heptose:LPS heptosyltransferase
VSAIGASAIDMTGRTSLGALAALIEGADLLVSNDTGVAHLAAAARTPSVIVSSGSDAARWAPGDTRLHRTLAHNIECRPCMYEDCPIGHPCALGTTVAAVLAEAEDLLAVSGGGR